MAGERVVELRDLIGAQGKGRGPLPSSLLELIDGGPAVWQQIASLAHGARQQGSRGPGGYALDQVRLHAPIPHPRKNVVCLGLNYLSHMQETARARGRPERVPEVPVFFTKAPTAVSGPTDPIPWEQEVTSEVDYEVELGVVIGMGGKNIARAKALEHVFGYTVVNDVSARDLQTRHLQWYKGKSLDGFCPMGPVVVTADELGDPQTKRVSLRVNGVVKQNSTTADMIFPVAAIIESLSRGMTLEPGDIISTGTPEGVGLGRTPPEYLRDGDLVEAEVEGIGTLRNRVTAVRSTP
jgi:2-keto-4-pentenoate hydratase/2-oxohepta-3-ene-1,7-dioic acid hydratase in catechol pathway